MRFKFQNVRKTNLIIDLIVLFSIMMKKNFL